jgi:site-specific DNA-methyltransferase (adenine-specific)
MSDGEIAFTSFQKATRQININRGYIAKNGGSIHPTQKPVKLYEWLLMNYAKENDKILDTHLGSGSIALACHNLGYDLTACELDKEYYDTAIKRIEQHKAQIRMF